MKSSNIKFSNDEIVIGDNVYYLSGNISKSIDIDYGSDIDGNRGMKVQFCDFNELDVLNENAQDVTKVEREIVIEYLEENWEKFV